MSEFSTWLLKKAFISVILIISTYSFCTEKLECPVNKCNAVFSAFCTNTIIKHLNIHTGTCLTCNICKNITFEFGCLLQHLKNKHGISNPKFYPITPNDKITDLLGIIGKFIKINKLPSNRSVRFKENKLITSICRIENLPQKEAIEQKIMSWTAQEKNALNNKSSSKRRIIRKRKKNRNEGSQIINQPNSKILKHYKPENWMPREEITVTNGIMQDLTNDLASGPRPLINIIDKTGSPAFDRLLTIKHN